MDTKNIGLRNIEVADTKISYIDGQKGKLIYRGYDILDLTKNSNFEETCFLLLHDELPTKNEYNNLKYPFGYILHNIYLVCIYILKYDHYHYK